MTEKNIQTDHSVVEAVSERERLCSRKNGEKKPCEREESETQKGEIKRNGIFGDGIMGNIVMALMAY